MSAKNKTAVVTGARQGIGKGIAVALAKASYNVVVSDLVQKDCDTVAKELTAFGVTAVGVKCDVSKKTEVDALINQPVKKFGFVDVLVNNAGIFPFVSF